MRRRPQRLRGRALVTKITDKGMFRTL